jgi:hypothetical protein
MLVTGSYAKSREHWSISNLQETKRHTLVHPEVINFTTKPFLSGQHIEC